MTDKKKKNTKNWSHYIKLKIEGVAIAFSQFYSDKCSKQGTKFLFHHSHSQRTWNKAKSKWTTGKNINLSIIRDNTIRHHFNGEVTGNYNLTKDTLDTFHICQWNRIRLHLTGNKEEHTSHKAIPNYLPTILILPHKPVTQFPYKNVNNRVNVIDIP